MVRLIKTQNLLHISSYTHFNLFTMYFGIICTYLYLYHLCIESCSSQRLLHQLAWNHGHI